MKETAIQNSKCYHIELKKKYTKEYIDNDTINILSPFINAIFPLRKLSNLPTGTQLASGGDGIQTQAV